MAEYKVRVMQIFSRVITVEADSQEEAVDQIAQRYVGKDIPKLTCRDDQGTTIEACEGPGASRGCHYCVNIVAKHGKSRKFNVDD